MSRGIEKRRNPVAVEPVKLSVYDLLFSLATRSGVEIALSAGEVKIGGKDK